MPGPRPPHASGRGLRLLAACGLVLAVAAASAGLAGAASAQLAALPAARSVVSLPSPPGSVGLPTPPVLLPTLPPAAQPSLCATCLTNPGTTTGPGNRPGTNAPGAGNSQGGPAQPPSRAGGGRASRPSGSSAVAQPGAGGAPGVVASGATGVGLRLVPPPVEWLGAVPGLTFGSAPYLWPLFLLLDVVAAMVAVLVIRKTWSSPVG